MVWVLWETSLVLYTQTLEDTAGKWVSGQAVLCGNSPDVPVSNSPDRSHFSLGEEMEKRTTGLCWWMSPVAASVQAVQFGALPVKLALGLDNSGPCHRDLQGKVSKK